MTDHQYGLRERASAALAAWRNPNPDTPCRHTTDEHWCVECSRDEWADTVLRLRAKLQKHGIKVGK